MNIYLKNINKVIDYIDQNLENPLTLDELSNQACFSKFHFHRIFYRVVKETPFQYILRIRLEKSANLLLNYPNKPLTEIANLCGFTHISIFSRNFKKHYKVTPTEFKKSNLSQTNSKNTSNPHKLDFYFCPMSNSIKWKSSMEVIKHVEVKRLESMPVGYNRNFGSYKGNNALYQKHRGELFAWAISKNLMEHPNFKYLILYHDNPNVVLNDTQRMSLCVTIPETIKTEGAIGKMDVEGGQYLVCSCELTAQDFPKVWEWIYGEWFPRNNYVPADKPYFELYTEQPKGEKFKVEFCIPVCAI